MRKEPKTPSEKARRATLGMIARLGACAYLVYIICNLIKMWASGDNGGASPVIVISTIIVFGAAAIVLIFLTVREFFAGVKRKDYSMHKYYQEELEAQGLKYNEEGELVPIDSEETGEKASIEEEFSEPEYEEDEYQSDDDELYEEYDDEEQE